jgi:hypothetical protein
VLVGALFLAGPAAAQSNENCLACHSDRSLTKQRLGRKISLYVDEALAVRSAHGDLDCVACHADLEKKDLPHDTPLKPVDCGACHDAEQKLSNECRHGKAAARGDTLAPSCRDCHGSHFIRRTDTDRFKIEITGTCGRCHEGIAEAYFDTYHGKIIRLGYTETAKCHDCHGAHNILPPTDPKSKLSRQNIVSTCRACHPGATQRFAGYLSHANHNDPKKYPFLFWTFWGMTGLVIGVFVVSGIHTLLWLPRALKMRRERKARAALPPDLPDTPDAPVKPEAPDPPDPPALENRS